MNYSMSNQNGDLKQQKHLQSSTLSTREIWVFGSEGGKHTLLFPLFPQYQLLQQPIMNAEATASFSVHESTSNAYIHIHHLIWLSAPNHTNNNSNNINTIAWIDNNRIAWLMDKGIQCALFQQDSIAQTILPANFPSPPLKVTLSSDANTLAIIRNAQQIELVSLSEGQGVLQTKKDFKLLGVHWISVDTFLLISEQGLELHQWQGFKKGLKLLKELKQSIQWYKYESRVIVISTNATTIIGYVIKAGGRIERLAKVSIQLRDTSHALYSIEAHLVQLYHRLYFLYVDSTAANILLYQITSNDITFKYNLSFMLPASSTNIKLSLIDNLLLVHNVESHITMLFDIKDQDVLRTNNLDTHYPLVAPLPIQWDRSPSTLQPSAPPLPPIYTLAWEYHESFIVSLTESEVYQIEVDIDSVSQYLDDPLRRLSFLLRRKHSKPLVVQLVRVLIERKQSLDILASLFDLLNMYVTTDSRKQTSSKDEEKTIGSSMKQLSATSTINLLPALKKDDNTVLPLTYNSDRFISDDNNISSANNSSNEMSTETRNIDGILIMNQDDMYRCIFLVVEEQDNNSNVDPRYLIGILVEYIRSLNFHKLIVEHFIYELLINLLVRNGRFNQLHQFLQYHVLSDSLHVACQLLSLETLYPPAYQLALDMLKRLASPEQIVEVLLSRGQVLAAVRLLKTHQSVKVGAQRFLEVAEQLLMQKSDSTLFYTVYTFFYNRHELTVPTYDRFHRIFEKLFGSAPIKSSTSLSPLPSSKIEPSSVPP